MERLFARFSLLTWRTALCRKELGGWRPGRNPPSVRGDICLIGIPAPRTAFIGAYYPFHNAGRRFTLTISLLDVFVSSPLTDAGFLSVSSPGLSPDVS